jgi:hypothetical protein
MLVDEGVAGEVGAWGVGVVGCGGGGWGDGVVCVC